MSPPREDGDAARGHGDRVGGALLAVEQGDFPEHFAGVEYREHDPASVDRVDTDPHAAPQNRHHAVALRSLGENGFAGVVAAHPHAGEQELSLVGTELAKKSALAEEPACVLGQAISGFVFQWRAPRSAGLENDFCCCNT